MNESIQQEQAGPDDEPYFDKIRTIWFDFFEGRLSAAARDMQLQPFRDSLAPLSPAHNFLMLETATAKELAVAEAVDRLVGVDSSYCPMYYELKRISRNEKFRGSAVKNNPVLPRLVFVTASFPDIPAVLAVQGVEGMVRNDWGVPEVVPGWEMDLFKVEIEKRRLWCLKMAAKGIKESKKAPKFASFADLKAWFSKNNQGESIDEYGEILTTSQAA